MEYGILPHNYSGSLVPFKADTETTGCNVENPQSQGRDTSLDMAVRVSKLQAHAKLIVW